jgi:hypothetical protein
MKFLPAILANLTLLISAVGYGSLLRGLVPASFRQIDRLALVLPAGLGLLGTLLFCLGQLWFSRWAILLILIPGIILGLKYLLWEVGQRRRITVDRVQIFLPAFIIAAVLLVTAIAGLAEPVGDIKMDAIAYHLLGAKIWVRDALIHPVTDECMTSFPAIVETQYAALMSLGGQRAPEFFSLLSLLSLLPITVSLALRLGLQLPGALWAAALTFVMPVVYRGAFGGFVDVIYSSLVLAALRVVFDAEKPAHYCLAGLFCGFAMGAKYFGVAACAIVTCSVFALAALHRQQTTRTLLRNLATLCVAALLVAFPWYLRNWLQLGSPIYPPTVWLSHFFHTPYLSPDAVRNFNGFFAKVQEGMGRGPLAFLLLPFHFTFHPANFINGPGGIGLAPLALGPFGLKVLRGNHFAQGLALFALLQMLVWFLVGQDPRYVIHVFVIAAIFSVLGWNYVSLTALRLGRLLAALAVACSVLYGGFMILSMRTGDLRAVFSSSYAEQRRREEIPFLDGFAYLNREPSVTKILVLEPLVPVYYLDKDYLRPTGRFGEHPLPGVTDLPSAMSVVSALRISHIMDVQFEGKSFRIADRPENLSLVFQSANVRIYAVNSVAAAAPSLFEDPSFSFFASPPTSIGARGSFISPAGARVSRP